MPHRHPGAGRTPAPRALLGAVVLGALVFCVVVLGGLVIGGSSVAAWPGAATTPSVTAGDYGYPYPNAPDCNEQTGANCKLDQWGFVQGQCHSWVAYRINELNAAGLHGTFNTSYEQPSGQEWGNVSHWGVAAAAAGITIDDTPELGSVAWWSDDGGHVGYVEAVNADGTVSMSEMNADLHNGFDFATLQRGVRWPTGFIHIADRPAAAVPGAPTGARATAGAGRATVKWIAPADNGSAITGFTVTGTPGGAVVDVGAGATSATVTGLQNGTRSTFTIHATNANGDGPESAATTAIVVGAPGRPKHVHATSGAQVASVTWTSAAAHGSPVTSYQVEASPGGAYWNVGANSTSCSATGLKRGTKYRFTVHAVNTYGEGPDSMPSNPVVPSSTG